MQERQSKRLDSEALWNFALKSLGGRAQSSGELREKLRRRAEKAGDVDEVLSRLKTNGLFDDRKYAESFAASVFPARSSDSRE